MAGDDTAALVVALSAQVSKFEKDMNSAVAVADRRTKDIENSFTAMNSAISNKLSQVGSAATGQIGLAGTVLSALGPAGVLAAAGIGLVVGGMMALATATAEFAAKAKALKEASETAGLTITQFKLLGSAGKTVGLDFDETTAFFTKFIANMEALRNGGGPLYDALLKIDVGLLRQLSATKDSAEAIDILISAYGRLDNQTSRLNLARAAGGRAGISGARLLDSLSEKGGLVGLEAANGPIDEGQIERAAKLKVEIEAIEKKTANIWGGMFSDDILQKQKAAAQLSLEIAQNIDKIAKGKERLQGGEEYDALGNFLGGISRDQMPPPERTPTFDERFSGEPGKGLTPYKKPTAPPPPPPSVELQILQKNLALLGDAVTQGEQYRQKQLEIAAAVEKGGISDGIAARALAAFNLVQKAAALAVRERLGVATEQQIVDVRLAQLQQDRIKYGLSENEVQRATVVILREAKQAAEALAVRQSYLPGLKQLELDARNLSKGLDSALTSGLNSFTDNLTDFITGAKSAKDAFADMTKSILSDIIKLSIRQTLIAPLAGLFNSSTGVSLFSNLGIGKNADGTDNWRGGLTWVGERGPEIVNLPRGAQVIPNDVIRSGGSGTTVSNVFQVAGEVSQETVNRLRDMIVQTQRGLGQTNRSLNSMQRLQISGVS